MCLLNVDLHAQFDPYDSLRRVFFSLFNFFVYDRGFSPLPRLSKAPATEHLVHARSPSICNRQIVKRKYCDFTKVPSWGNVEICSVDRGQ